MRLIKHEAPLVNPALGTVSIVCPFCRVSFEFAHSDTGIYSHQCADTKDRVFILNGHAWTGVIAFIKSERPGR